MPDNKKVIESLERENSINKDKIQTLQLMAGIHTEQLSSLTTNVRNNPLLDTEPGIVKPNNAIIVSKDGTIDNLTIDNLKVTGSMETPSSNTDTNTGTSTNTIRYYQTVNSFNDTVGDNGGTDQETFSGCPSSSDDWTQYTSWKTTSADVVNTDATVFSPENYGFEALAAGRYKITVNMAFHTLKTNQMIVIRLAKNGLNDDDPDSDNENPGPLAGTGLIKGTDDEASGEGFNEGEVNSFGSAMLTHMIVLNKYDKISVYTTNVSPSGSDNSTQNCFTREGYSQLLVEYLGGV